MVSCFVKNREAKKRWKTAEQIARRLPHQSVYVLNLRGCLLTLAGQRAKAAACFTRALKTDNGCKKAMEGLMQINQPIQRPHK